MFRLNATTLTIIAAVAISAIVFLTRPGRQSGGSGPPMAQVTIPAFSSAGRAGEKLFNANCASCHGKNAAGQDGVAPPLVHKIYEPRHHGDISFRRAAKYGVRSHHWSFGNMPPVPGVNEAGITNIIAYVRELQRANGIY